jgi:hypothetical protein
MGERLHYLVSAAGTPNLGDEWITWSWLRFITEQDPEATVVLDCLSPANVATLIRGETWADRVVPVDFLWRTVRRFAQTDLWAARCEIDVNWPGRMEAYSEAWGLASVGRPETIHILGGGFINGLWSENWLLTALCAKLKDHWGAELRWTGAGIVPSSEVQCFDFSKFLRRFDHVSCRDGHTAALLERSGVRDPMLGVDDIGLGLARNDIVLPVTEPGARAVVVNLQRDLFDSESYARTCRDTAQLLRAEAPDVILYAEMFPGSDLGAFDFLIEQGFPVRRITFTELFRATVRLSGHQPLVLDPRTLCVTSRYHLHLYAALAGFSGSFASARPDYYDVKHDAVRSWGSRWTRLGDGGCGEGIPADRRWTFCEGKLEEAGRLYPARPDSRAGRTNGA